MWHVHISCDKLHMTDGGITFSQYFRSLSLPVWSNCKLWSNCQMVGVRCHVSGVTCQVSGVMCHIVFVFVLFCYSDKVVDGGSVNNGAYPI